MASITVSREDLYPNGTTVSAYEVIETRPPTSGAPSGSVVDSGVVSGGSVTLDGLDESTSYWLYASSPDRYLRVYIPLPEAAQSGSVAPATVRRLTRPLVSVGSRGTIYANGFSSGLAAGQISGHRMQVRVVAGDLAAVYPNWGFGGGVAAGNPITVACAFEHPISGKPFKAYLDTGEGHTTIDPGGIAIFRRGMPALPDGDYDILVRTWYSVPVDGDDVPSEWAPTNTVGEERWLIEGIEDDLLGDITPEYPSDFYYSPAMLCSGSALPADTPCIVVEADSNVATHDGLNFFERALALLDDVVPHARLSVAGGGIAGYVETRVDSTDAGGGYWRLVALSGGTHAVLAGYTNSLASRTAAQLITDTELTIQMYQRLGFEGVILCTAPPHLDGIFTNTTPPSDQVIDTASEPTRVELNDALRAFDFASTLPYWIADTTSAVEANVADDLELNGGYWQTGTTQDGTHIHSTGGAPQMATILADAIQHLVIDGETGGISQADLTPPTPAAPVNTVAPAITPGTCNAGDTLTCSTGTWTGSPTPTYARQWKRDGVNIGGATSSTYVTVDPTDTGHVISCTVTATNTQGSASAASSNTVTPASPPSEQTPADIFGANLKQWQKPSTLGSNGSSVSSWTDSSGNSNPLTQATGGKQPTVVTNLLNGKSGVRFDGTDDQLLHTYGAGISQPCEVFMVAKFRSAPTGFGPYYTAFSPENIGKWDGSDVALVAGASISTASGAPDDAFGAWHFVPNGASSAIRLNNTSVITGDAGTDGLDSFTVGTDWSGLPAAIDIVEIVVINRTSTSGERNSMDSYFATEYGI